MNVTQKSWRRPRTGSLGEAGPWFEAADEAGLELPDELVKLRGDLDRLKDEHAAVAKESAEKIEAVTELVRGMSLADAHAAETEARRKVEDLHERREIAARAVSQRERSIKAWVDRHREELITGPLRQAVAAVIEEAKVVADKLAEFAPEYDAERIAREGTKADLDAYRASRNLNDKWWSLLRAWWASWREATSSRGTHKTRVPRHLVVSHPGGLHVWENPDAIEDENVRDGRNVELLAIARYADAGGYRLAGGREMMEIDSRENTYYPHLYGERKPRRVLLSNGPRRRPKGEPDPEEQEEPKRKRVVIL